MSYKRGEEICLKYIRKFPELKEQITDLFHLYVSEIEDGESEENEYHLLYSSLKDISNFKI